MCYLLKDRVCGCIRVIAVKEQVVVHTEDATPFPKVLIEEQQVLWYPLKKPEDSAHHAGY